MPFDKVTWEDGYTWAEGDKSVEVRAGAKYVGIAALTLDYKYKDFRGDYQYIY